MENNYGSFLQWGIFFLGIIYFITDAIRTFKRESFQCLKNKMLFLIGLLGAISVLFLLMFIYYIYCIHHSYLPEQCILRLLCFMSLIFPLSGYCYFKSLLNENEYKLLVGKQKLSAEFSTWKKKKTIFIYIELLMIGIVLVSIIGIK